MNQSRNVRCLNCRSEVSVPDSYADGSQIACSNCGVQLRIIRGDPVRLVIADLIALHETQREGRLLITRTTRELQAARASWGIGVNGLGIGVLYIVAQMALEERELNQGLVLEAATLAVFVGVLLELANHLFLAKRRAISRLTEQMRQAVADQREIDRKVRESSRR